MVNQSELHRMGTGLIVLSNHMSIFHSSVQSFRLIIIEPRDFARSVNGKENNDSMYWLNLIYLYYILTLPVFMDVIYMGYILRSFKLFNCVLKSILM